MFSFSYKDAAILPDGSRADVILTYSNLHIALQRTLVGDYKCQTYICSGNMLRAGNSYPNPSSNNSRNGLQVDVNIRIADRFGNTVDGSFMYPMSDIDVSVSYGSATISQRTDFNVLWSEDGVNYYYDNSHTPDDATAELACTDAAVTNLKLQSLTLKKEVTGPTGDLGSKWDFTLHIPCLKGMTVTAKLNGNDKTLEFNGNGTAAVRMGHNDLLIIDSLPCSSEYTITENTDPLYTQGYSINGSDMIPGNSTGVQAISDDTIIKFTNDSAVSPPTGLFTSSAPWLIMLMIAAALLLFNRMRSVDTLDP